MWTRSYLREYSISIDFSLELDSNVGKLTELPIDSSHYLVDVPAEVSVLLYLFVGGHCDLNEDSFTNVIRMISQKHFKGPQFPRYAFDIVFLGKQPLKIVRSNGKEPPICHFATLKMHLVCELASVLGK